MCAHIIFSAFGGGCCCAAGTALFKLITQLEQTNTITKFRTKYGVWAKPLTFTACLLTCSSPREFVYGRCCCCCIYTRMYILRTYLCTFIIWWEQHFTAYATTTGFGTTHHPVPKTIHVTSKYNMVLVTHLTKLLFFWSFKARVYMPHTPNNTQARYITATSLCCVCVCVASAAATVPFYQLPLAGQTALKLRICIYYR